jgi:DNA repair exonuclease SbcCD ATPase subunit
MNMAIYNLDGLLDKYSSEFLILEFNHLFISSSIREEVWLLQRNNDSPLIDKIVQAAREFNILEVSAERDFETYSGGQKAILACLLTLALITNRKIHGLKLLFNNILDSVSEENRSKLVQKFEEIRPTHNIRLFTEKDGHIQEIFTGNGNPQG